LRWYPAPYPLAIEAQLAQLYGVSPAHVLATRGSDEAIDLLVRAFCAAGRDAIVTFPPTFGMYAIAANVQGAAVLPVETRAETGFALDIDRLEGVLAAQAGGAPKVKLVFACSPNNPTGNLIPCETLERLLRRCADALVVIDEAYLEFAETPSFARRLEVYDNLVVLRTLSKAWGLAGARCGVAIAHPCILDVLRRIRLPYALTSSTLAAVTALTAGEPPSIATRLAHVRAERARVAAALTRSPWVKRVWPSDANFVLVECTDAPGAVARAAQAQILVRSFHDTPALRHHVRVSIGSPSDNDKLLAAWSRA
jgi:histidinol-phosphate aminotransferase